MSQKFLRRNCKRFVKLGKGKKKAQAWRSQKGRHGKMREKMRGYPAIVGIGHRTEKAQRDKIQEKIVLLVNNLKDLEKATSKNLIVIGKIGNKKKLEIAKKAKEKKLEVSNLNINKFIKTMEKKKWN